MKSDQESSWKEVSSDKFHWEASTENEKLDQVATSHAESIRFVSILDFRRISLTVEKDF